MLRDADITSNDSRVALEAEMSYLDLETIKNYRNRFEFRNKGHIWNDASDEDFLVFLGAAGKEAKGVYAAADTYGFWAITPTFETLHQRNDNFNPFISKVKRDIQQAFIA